MTNTESFWCGFSRGTFCFWSLLFQLPVLLPVFIFYLLPFTAFGLLQIVSVRVGPFGLPVVEFWATVDEYDSARWWRWLWAGWSGHALPCAIVLRSDLVDYTPAVRHEMRHVWQWCCWGCLFPVVYLVLLAVQGYEKHWLEQDAKEAEGPRAGGEPW